MAQKPPPIDAVLDRLKTLHPKAIDLSLGRIARLLDRLGNPHASLPPVLHVAGTNGKGSLVAYLRAMLEAAGYRVHVYTSPHLVRFSERIRIAGEEIGAGPLAALLEECEHANAGAAITFFEITTAAAFLAFARTPADVTLLETGLGGRLDTTNMVARPALTAITPIALDHQPFLGDSLAQIAFEKAGILKPGIPAVIGPQPDEAIAVLAARATESGAPLFRHGDDWTATGDAHGMTYRSAARRLDLPPPGLTGPHQIDNAGLALACMERLEGFSVSDAALGAGLRDVIWPARLQRLTLGPLAEQLPPGWELWLDGGHNPAAAKALARMAESWRDRPFHVIVGHMNNRDCSAFLRPLAPTITRLYGVPIPGEANSQSAAAITQAATEAGIAAIKAASPNAALASLISETRKPARVLICGSLYLAGHILDHNG